MFYVHDARKAPVSAEWSDRSGGRWIITQHKKRPTSVVEVCAAFDSKKDAKRVAEKANEK